MSLKRENFIFFLICCSFSVLIFQLFNLQIKKGDYYRALSLGLSLPPLPQKERGKIFFRDGEIAATNELYYYLVLVPSQIENKEKLAKFLSQVLNLNEEEILNKMNEKSVILEIGKDQEKVKEIQKMRFKGVFIEERFKRYYPNKNLASNVIGFVGGEGKGQYGIEEYYDEKLQNGEDIVLTLDYQIQFEAERILAQTKDQLAFERGHILVLNPENGEVLAMATYPNFDPNEYQKYADNLEIFKNPFTQEIYEPGSTFKPITMAIAIEEGKITPETTYEDPGEIKIDGWTIRNYDNKKFPGKITMTEVLEKSINTGAVFAQRQVEGIVFLNYLKKFGVFDKTGIDLPEIVASNQEIQTLRPINLATASFGQGIALTPIQLVKIYCALANGGKVFTPHLNKNFPNVEEKKVLSPETLKKLNQMLISVVENGLSQRAKIPGYFIAGKTGTSQQPKVGERGYSEKTWQSFIGYFPAYNPKYLILVKLDNPKKKIAGYTAVPIFRELAEFIIKVKKISPDYEPNQ